MKPAGRANATGRRGQVTVHAGLQIATRQSVSTILSTCPPVANGGDPLEDVRDRAALCHITHRLGWRRTIAMRPYSG